MPLQIRRGTAAERTGLTAPLVIGELLYVTDQGKLYIGDGTSIGSTDIVGNPGQGGKGLVITGFTSEDAQDATALLFSNGTHTNISFTYNDGAESLSADIDLSSYVGNINVQGTIDADFKGSLFADDSGLLVDAVDRKFFGDLEGNVVGSVVGDLKGSVFGDDSTLLIDAVSSTIPASVVSGTFTGNVIGNISGNVTGNVITNLISSSDSSTILVDTPTNFQTQVDIDGSVRIFDGLEIVASDAASRQFELTSSFETVESSTLIFRRSRGNFQAPTIVQTNDILGGFVWNAYTGSIYDTSATVYLEVKEISAGVVSPSLKFNFRRPVSSGGDIATIVKIDHNSVNIYARDPDEIPLHLWNFHETAGNAANFVLTRARGVIDTPATVLNGDAVYDIVFRAHDGTTTRLVSQIRASIDGAVSTGITPGRLDFSLADGSGVNTGILRLTNDKVVHADKIGGLSNNYTEFTQMPVLPTYADETAADTAIGGSGNRVNGMMYYDSGSSAVKAVVGGAWTAL